MSSSKKKMSKSLSSNLIPLLKYLIRSYAVDNDLSTDELDGVQVYDFYNWCKRQLNKIGDYEFDVFDSAEFEDPLFPDKEELKKQLGVTDEDLEFTRAFVANPDKSVGFLQVCWPLLICGLGKPPEPDQIAGIQLVARLMYKDGTVITIPMSYYRDIIHENTNGESANDKKEEDSPFGEKLSTGVILSTWLSQINQLARTIIKYGGVHGVKLLSDADETDQLVKNVDPCNLPFGFGPFK